MISLLRQEAYGLLCAIFAAMLRSPSPARLARLRHARHRAERRYWRRYEKDYPPGNRTPDWMVKTANPGY